MKNKFDIISQLSGLLLVCVLVATPMLLSAAEPGGIGIQRLVASTTTAVDCPAQQAFDNNSATAWRLDTGEATGFIEAYFETPTVMYGIRLSGNAPSDAKIVFEFLSGGVWLPYAQGTLSGANWANAIIDLSFEDIAVDAVALRVLGANGATTQINEIEILGEPLANTTRALRIAGSSANVLSSAWYPLAWLSDGNPLTAWTGVSISSRLFSSQDAASTMEINQSADQLTEDQVAEWNAPLDELRYVERYLIERREQRPALGADAENARSPADTRSWFMPTVAAKPTVELTLAETSDLEAIRLYLAAQRSASIRIQVKSNGQWHDAGTVPQLGLAGWYQLEAEFSLATAVRLVYENNRNATVYGINEVEVWGTGRASINPYVPICTNAVSFSEPLNFSFTHADLDDRIIEIVTAPNDIQSLSIEVNGFQLSAQPTLSDQNCQLYQFFLPQALLWAGDNYLRIIPRAHQDTLLLARTVPSGSYRKNYFGATGLSDGAILSPVAISGEHDFTFNETVLPYRIEVFSIDGSFPQLFIKDKLTDEWVELYSTDSNSLRKIFQCESEINGIKMINWSSGLAEIRIIASPTEDHAPEIKLLQPSFFALGIPLLNLALPIIGFVDNPAATVTINGIRANVFRNYFSLMPQLLNVLDGEDALLCIEATDQKGRVTRHEIRVFCGDSYLIELDNGNDTIYTASLEATISGRCANNSFVLEIGGVPAVIGGRRFSVTIPVEEGFNLVPLVVRSRQSGRIIHTFYCKVVSYSQPASLVITSPVDGSVTSQPNIQVSGFAMGVKPLTVTVNGSLATIEGDRFTSPLIELVEGSNDVFIELKDAMGRTVTGTITIIRDSIAPNLAILSPTSNSQIQGFSVTLRGTVQDATQSWVSIESRLYPIEGSNFSVQISLIEGWNTLRLSAVDQAGNYSSPSSLTLYCDASSPEAFQPLLTPSGWTSTTSPVLSFTTTDRLSGVDHYEISINSGNFFVAQSPYTLPTLTDGTHNIAVKAIDRVGNSTVGTTQAYIDTTPPMALDEVGLIPGNGILKLTWLKSSPDTVIYQVTELGIDLSSSSDDIVRCCNEAEMPWDNLDNGRDYYFEVLAIDRAGNRSQATRTQGTPGEATETYNEAGVVVLYDNVTMIIPPEALPEGIVSVTITEVSSDEMLELAVFPIISPIYSFDVMVAQNGELVAEANVPFKEEFACILGYNPALVPEGFPEENLGIYYFDTEWSRWVRVPNSMVDPVTNQIYFHTNHFTNFAVQPTMLEDIDPQSLRSVQFSPMAPSTAHAGLSISPAGGTVMTEMTEFTLPGPDGFDFTLSRRYDTATARSDAFGLAIAGSVGINLSAMSNAAMIKDLSAQVLGSLSSNALANLEAYVDSLLMNCGDYAYSMGAGWRLNLPYVRHSTGSIMLRLPDGGFYTFEDMEVVTASDLGASRTISLECHQGSDFSFMVFQTRRNLKVTSLNINKPASIIAAWSMNAAVLTLKDGTRYLFNSRGCVTKIIDPSGKHEIVFSYSNRLLSTITDAYGREIHFEYNPFVLPAVITKIIVPGEAPREITYSHNGAGALFTGMRQLTSAVDIGGRAWTYVGGDTRFIVSGGIAVKVNVVSLLLQLIPGTTDLVAGVMSKLGMDAITFSANIKFEVFVLLNSISGPGIGYQSVVYEDRNFGTIDIKPADYILWVIPTAVEISGQLETRVLGMQLNVFIKKAGALIRQVQCAYEFAPPQHGQNVILRAVVDDQRTRTVHTYTSYTRLQQRFMTTSDYLMEHFGGISFSGINIVHQPLFDYIVMPYETSVEMYPNGQANLIERRTMTYDYQKGGRLLSQNVWRSASRQSNAAYEYDEWGNVIRQTETRTTSIDRVTTETVSEFLGCIKVPANVSWYTSPTGFLNVSLNTPVYIADWGAVPYRLISHAPATLPIRSQTTTTRSRNGETHTDTAASSYQYDMYGRLTASATNNDANWLITRRAYNPTINEVSQITLPNSQVIDYEHNYNADLITSTIYRSVLRADGQTDDISSTVSLSAASGAKQWECDGRGYITVYTYDQLGRVTSIIMPDDNDVVSGDAAIDVLDTSRNDNPVQLIEYDDDISDGFMTVEVTNPLEAFSSFSFDGLGRLTKIEKTLRATDADGLVDADGSSIIATTLVSYDSWDNITSITDASQQVVNYQYDVMGRQTRVTYPDNTYRETKYTYATGILETWDEMRNYSISHLGWQDEVLLNTHTLQGASLEDEFWFDGFGREIRRRIDSGTTRTDVTETSYNLQGKVATITLPAMMVRENAVLQSNVRPVIVYRYDDGGYLRMETRNDANGNPGLVTETEVDGLGRPIRVLTTWTDYRGTVASVTKAETFNYYDANGNLERSVDPNGNETEREYTARGKVATETSAESRITSYTYDALNQLLTMTDPRGNDSGYVGDFIIEYRYDDAGRLIRGFLPRSIVNGQQDNTVSQAKPIVAFEYNLVGTVSRRIDPDGTSISYAYNDRNQLVEETYHDGSQAQAIYNRVTYEYDDAQRRTAIINTLNDRTEMIYNELNLVSSQIMPSGATQAFEYDAYGNCIIATSARNTSWFSSYTYAAYGRLTSSKDALGNLQQLYYDRYGYLTASIDANNRITEFLNDEFGRCVQETRADNSVRTMTYDAMGHLSSYLDPRGVLAQYEYTADYLLDTVARSRGGQPNETTEYVYDAGGILRTLIENDVSINYNTDRDGNYRSDPYGRIHQQTTSVGGKTYDIGYQYNLAGRPTMLSYPDLMRPTIYGYDSAGRLSTVSGLINEAIQYDSVNRPINYGLSNGIDISRTYWADGYLKTLNYNQTGQNVEGFALYYDADGNVTTRNQSRYEYDRLNRVITSTEEGLFAARNNPMATYPQPVMVARRDVAGQKVLESFIGSEVDVTLDSDSLSLGVDLSQPRQIYEVRLTPREGTHRVTSAQLELLTSDNGTIWQRIEEVDYRYEAYDDGSILLTIPATVTARFIKAHCLFDERNAANLSLDEGTFRNQPNSLFVVGYYERYRTEQFEYDAQGNRTTTTLNFANQIIETDYAYYAFTDRIQTRGEITYLYDGAGNLTERGKLQNDLSNSFLADEHYRRFTYDLSNRLIAVYNTPNQASQPIAAYIYGPDGMRLQKQNLAGTTTYLFDQSGNEIFRLEDLADGSQRTTKTIWLGGRKLAAIIDEAGQTRVRYFLTDNQGTVTVVTDETGQIVWQANTTAFGEATAGYGSEAFEASYTGKDYDADTELLYYNARWYDPELGRFITEDPVRDGINWYVYCNNSPLVFTDPTGLEVRLLTDTSSAALRGHSAILIDAYDEDGNVTGSFLFEVGPVDRRRQNPVILSESQFLGVDVFVTMEYYPVGGDELATRLERYNMQTSFDTTQAQDEIAMQTAQEEAVNFGDYKLFTNNCAHYTGRVLESIEIDVPPEAMYEPKMIHRYINQNNSNQIKEVIE